MSSLPLISHHLFVAAAATEKRPVRPALRPRAGSASQPAKIQTARLEVITEPMAEARPGLRRVFASLAD